MNKRDKTKFNINAKHVFDSIENIDMMCQEFVFGESAENKPTKESLEYVKNLISEAGEKLQNEYGFNTFQLCGIFIGPLLSVIRNEIKKVYNQVNQ